jgi:hypothetical protein
MPSKESDENMMIVVLLSLLVVHVHFLFFLFNDIVIQTGGISSTAIKHKYDKAYKGQLLLADILPFASLEDVSLKNTKRLQTLLKTCQKQVLANKKGPTETNIVQPLWSNEQFKILWKNLEKNSGTRMEDTHDKKNVIQTQNPDATIYLASNPSSNESTVVYHIDHKSYNDKGFQLSDIMHHFNLSRNLLAVVQPNRLQYIYFLNDGVHFQAFRVVRNEMQFSLFLGPLLFFFDEKGNAADGFRLLVALITTKNISTLLGYNNPTVSVQIEQTSCPVSLCHVIGSGSQCFVIEGNYENPKTKTRMNCAVKWYREVLFFLFFYSIILNL